MSDAAQPRPASLQRPRSPLHSPRRVELDTETPFVSTAIRSRWISWLASKRAGSHNPQMGILEASKSVTRMRRQWTYRGDTRPAFAQAPRADQESVWDYPRPPCIQADPRPVEVRYADQVLAQSVRSLRVLETASPPTYYIPPEDVQLALLAETGGTSHCEWKGIARDLGRVGGPSSIGWVYPDTYPEFAEIAGWISFYPARVECFVAGERVRPQPGGFYGGWITDAIVGPVKGEPGCDGL